VKEASKRKSPKQFPFVGPRIAYRFYLVSHKGKYLSRAVKAFIDMALGFTKKGWPK